MSLKQLFPLAIAVALFILAPLFLVIVLLFFPLWIPAGVPTSEPERIGLSSLLVGVANLATLAGAVWEFIRSQRKPLLKPQLIPLDRSLRHVDRPSQESKSAVQYTSTTGVGTVYDFIFSLNLENSGTAVARWVKVTLELAHTRVPIPLSPTLPEFTRLSPNPAAGAWEPSVHGTHARIHAFRGGTDFVVFTHPRSIADVSQWLEEIGTFVLRVPTSASEKLPSIEIKLLCSVQAEDFVMHAIPLRFRLT